MLAEAIISRGGQGRDFYLADAGRLISLYPSKSPTTTLSFQKLVHPNIVTLHSVYSYQGVLYFAYDFERIHLNDIDSYPMNALHVTTILWDVLSGFIHLRNCKVPCSLDNECIYITTEGVAKIGNWAGRSLGGEIQDYKIWAQAFLASRQDVFTDDSFKRLKRLVEEPLEELTEVC